MDYKIITDIQDAKKIWNLLSPHKTIDDEWDFRYTFLRHLPYELYFVVGYENGKISTLLPLQKNNGEGLMPPYASKDKAPFYEFFGGDDTDDNTLLGKQLPFEEFKPYLSLPTYLAPLHSMYENDQNASYYESRYFIDVSNYTSFEDFLRDKWSKDSRKKILQQIRGVYRNHEVKIIENNYEDIDRLSQFNIKRFGDKSSFIFPYRAQIFKELTKLYTVVMLTVVVDGVKEAVSYGIKYKDTYVGMNAGVSGKITDLPKLLIMLQIDKTIQLGCKTYDAGKGDSGWKESYKLDKISQYKISLIPQDS
ncbi:MAG: GNAT family N-acetyltransferase [Candidatus Levyibacteriota bacterium]